jgi:filamentous hemagglutinin family protein
MSITAEWHGVIFALLYWCSLSAPAIAQEAAITADGTTATDVITPDGSNFDIDGGDKAGSNLFHSFGNFGVPDGGSANFLNPVDIANIISRVTGGKTSTIEGLIKANGSANLFLINPAGIIFGPNASLNIGGSFLGSTADSLLFPEGEFSATNLQTPPLLTINAPIGLNLRDNPVEIGVQNSNLQMNPGQNLTLVGGKVSLDAGKIAVPGGRVELGGLSAEGTVGINNDGSLSFPDDVTRSDVFLGNGASVSVLSEKGGSIAINSKNLELKQGSSLGTGIAADLGNPESQAGNIVVNATNEVFLDNSFVKNLVETGSVGNAGNIQITTNNLSLKGGAQINTSTAGQGNAGKVTINASGKISADGENLNFEDGSEPNPFSNQSGIFSQVEATGTGKAGGIDIAANQLTLTNGATIDTTTFGRGDGGTITIKALDTVALEGEDDDGFVSAISSNVYDEKVVGNGGEIKLDTGNLLLNNGAIIVASTSGKGNAGTIAIKAADTITADGVSQGGFRSGIFVNVAPIAQGNAGGIVINTAKLNVTNGGQINANTSGTGDAGSVSINAADTITADGVAPDSNDFLKQSGVFSQVDSTGVGNAGNIQITTGNLSLKGGAQINTSTAGQGNAGKVTINASGKISADGENLNFEDGSEPNPFSNQSGIFSQVEATGTGKAGGIDIAANQLTLTNGATIDTTTFGRGDGGTITIKALDTVALEGEDDDGFVSAISSNVYDEKVVGNGGEIKLDTGNLLLNNGAIIVASTSGKGNAGTIAIKAADTITADGVSQGGFRSGIFVNVAPIAQGNAGGIVINTAKLNVTNGGQINANTSGTGDAGSVSINAADTITANGVAPDLIDYSRQSGVFSKVDSTGLGNAGNIQITTGKLSVSNGAGVAVDNQGQGNGGNLSIQTNFLSLNNNASITATTNSGEGGNTNLQVKDLLLMRDNSLIRAGAFGDAVGGNINIDAGFIVAIPNQNNDLIARAAIGQGGNINISTQRLFGIEQRSSQPINRTNDIDASAEFNLAEGFVVTNFDVVRKPENIVEPDTVVAQACDYGSNLADRNTFTITGRGGMPPSPTEMLRSSFIQVSGGAEEQRGSDAEEQRGSDAEEQRGSDAEEQRGSDAEEQGKRGDTLSLDENKKTFSSDEVIPARGMMVNDRGQIVLTAYPTPNAGERTAPKSNYCSINREQATGSRQQSRPVVGEVLSTSQLTFDTSQKILKMKLDELLSRLKEQQNHSCS